MSRHLHPVLVLLLALVGCSLQPDAHQHASPSDQPIVFDNLGSYHQTITTSSPQAQAYFDQGLRLVYGFNHLEAQRAFREAARLDPACAMCSWGIALTYGSNYNSPTDADRERGAYEAIQRAQALASGATERERATIEALAQRHAPPPGSDRAALDRAYADAMREVARRFPGDLDAGTLFADALMNLRPWNLWTPDGKPQPGTEEILATLERVLAAKPDHPGANHLYIHAVEASPRPDRGLAAADRLAALMPGAGHLVHMPSHIYLRVGRYADAVAANVKAVAADRAYFEKRRPAGLPYVTGVWRYTRGLAFSATGRPAEAARELADLEATRQVVAPERSVAGFFKTAEMLRLAAEVLAAEIAARAGDTESAVQRLSEAVKIQDGHWFTEPPPWYYPVRQSLGAVLLEGRRPAEAEAVYREDLRRNPENGWALFGLAQSLRAQGKTSDAGAVDERFRKAWAQADVTLTASRF